MNDTFVTVQGWVGAEVRHRTPKGTSVATLRVAATPRLRKGGDWADGETTWYTVTAWRTLADNVRDSVRKGDAVIVHGRLRTETWVPDKGDPVTSLHVEAGFVGHDLTRGTSVFTKSQRPERVEQEVESELAEMVHEALDDDPSVSGIDSWGEPRAASEEEAA
jgi:single-strand DNA-binding protein